MRHSAWTLWLVPLVMPLALLCIPGAREPLDHGPQGYDWEAHELALQGLTALASASPAVVLPPPFEAEEPAEDASPI
jgi:hypothetical protein